MPVLRMTHSEAFYRVCVKVLLEMHGHFRSEKSEETFFSIKLGDIAPYFYNIYKPM
jgi:hypothetical protein